MLDVFVNFSYLHVSLGIFFLGLWGVLIIRSNLISVLIAIELLLFSCNFNFVIFSVFFDDVVGQLFALFVLTVAAAESAIGLALVVVYYRVRGNISVDYVNFLKG